MSIIGPQIRTLTEDDGPALRAFLERHAALALPLLLRLERGGIVCTGHAGQAHYLAVVEREQVRAVLALGTDGLVMLMCPDATDLSLLAQSWTDWFEGAAQGLMGPREQIEGLIALLGGDTLPFRFNNTESVSELHLDRLPEPMILPHCDGRWARSADLETLVSWRLTWLAEVMHMPLSESLANHVAQELQTAIAHRRVAVLEDDGMLVAMGQCMMSATTISQLGGFFVPENLRGKAYGLTMIDRLCRLERQRGITRSLVLSNRRSAALNQSIEQLGFRHEGYMGVVLFDPPVDARHPTATAVLPA